MQHWMAWRMFITHLKDLWCSRCRWHWSARRMFLYLRRTRCFFLQRTRRRHWMFRAKLTWWRFQPTTLPSYSREQQSGLGTPLNCVRQGHDLQLIQIRNSTSTTRHTIAEEVLKMSCGGLHESWRHIIGVIESDCWHVRETNLRPLPEFDRTPLPPPV